MKRYLLVLALFFFITIPAYSDLFHSGIQLSHDGDGHVIRLVEFDKALSDGAFPVRWSKRLNFGLGYPFFNFDYPMIYFFGDILHRLGLSYIDSTKALFLLSFPLSGFFAYLWLKTRFNDPSSFAGGLIYTIAPYHFLNVYVRADLGEVIALTLVPLALFFLERLRKSLSIRDVAFLSLVMAGIITSHNLTALIFLPIIGIYGVVTSVSKKDRRFLKNLIFAFDLGFFLSCFFWLPALFDRRYIVIDTVLKSHISEHFVRLRDLVIPSWGYSLSGVSSGMMSFQVGVIHLAILLLAIPAIVLGKRKITADNLMLLGLFIFLIAGSAYMMLPQSLGIWDRFSMLGYLQFPWRLLGVIILAISYITALSFNLFGKNSIKLVVVLIFFLLIANKDYTSAFQYIQGSNSWYQDAPFKGTTTAYSEHTPLWQDTQGSLARFSILEGEANISSEDWKTNYHLYTISADTPILMSDQTVYFPGWSVYVDNKPVSLIDPGDKKSKGLITFLIPEGKHRVEVKLLEPPIHKFADYVSLIGLVAAAGMLWLNKRKKGFRVWS